MKLLSLTSLFLCLLVLSARAQEDTAPRWSYRLSSEAVHAGDQVDIIFTASIDKEWYLYSSDLDPELGPLPTQFHFEKNGSFELVGEVQAIEPKKKYDRTWQGDIRYFAKKAEFRQKIKVLKDTLVISGKVQGQVCSEHKGECLPFIESFQL